MKIFPEPFVLAKFLAEFLKIQIFCKNSIKYAYLINFVKLRAYIKSTKIFLPFFFDYELTLLLFNRKFAANKAFVVFR